MSEEDLMKEEPNAGNNIEANAGNNIEANAGNNIEPVSGSSTHTVEAEPYLYENDQDTEKYKRSYAANYIAREKPKSIFVMTLGMPAFAGILDRPPLSIIKRKDLNEAYVPKADDFKHEVKRRAHFFMNVEEEANYFTEELKRNHPLKTRRNKVVMPQPNQWLNTNLKKWLAERPMKPNDKDIEFLQAEVTKALNYLGTESLIEANEPNFITSPKPSAAPVLFNMATPATNTLSLPVLPADEHSYTSVNDTDEYKRSAALTYSKLASKPRVVIAMALGMIEYQGLLDRPPFSTARRKELTDDFMPRAEDYRYEIRRRAHFFMNVEEESEYFTKDLKKKHPLENMRGVVQLPQPAQWKIQALRGWLSERPLRPSKEDSAFIQESMQKIMGSLDAVMEREKAKTEIAAQKPGDKLPWGTGHSVGAMGEKDDMLFECLNKQDAVLAAVNKQNQSQTILNKITVLNQSIAGYQAEISSHRSTLNDVENRIMTLEMKIAEAPAGADKLNEMVAEQKENKEETISKIKDLEEKIGENREEISTLAKEMEEISVVTEEDVANTRKRKLEETEEINETMEV